MTGVSREQLPICSNTEICWKFHELISEQSPKCEVSYVLLRTWVFRCFVDHRLPVEEMQLLWVADIPVNVSPSLRLDLLSSNLIARPILRKIGLRELFWDWSFLCQILHPGANLYSRERAGMEYDDWQALGRERAFRYHNQLHIFCLGLRDP